MNSLNIAHLPSVPQSSQKKRWMCPTTYHLVQDLRAINQIVQAKHPVVLNPYTVLSKIPYNHEWLSVIDLKDAFWACPLDASIWDIFVFE
jgi:hypothetical protein